MTSTSPAKRNYVDNVKFYEALITYGKKVKQVKAEYNTKVTEWKRLCRPILRAFREETPSQYRNFLEDKKIREETGKWPRDIVLHYELPAEPAYLSPRIPEYIGLCVYLIATGLSGYWKFNQYSYRDEMAADGIEDCILRIQSFDPAKSKNPFAYFTQICYFAAIRRIKKEKKQKLVKSEIVKNSGIIDSLSNNVQSGDDGEYHNAYLTFLLENVDANTMTDDEKKESAKMKKTTLASQKKVREKENAIALNVEGIDGVDLSDVIEPVVEKPEINFGLDDGDDE
jgi:hypothetical protein